MYVSFFNMILALVSFVFLLSSMTSADNQFHEDLKPEERKHYFGTELIEEVPQYHYASPKPIDRRRRYSDDRSDLEYHVDIFGERTHLVLEENKDLIAPGCVVHYIQRNGTKHFQACRNEINCFYTGRIRGQRDSWVSASVCGGFHAVIGGRNNTFVVQPVRSEHVTRARRDTSIITPHVVYTHRDKRDCRDIDGSETLQTRRFRSKRSAARKYIETTVVVEPDVYKFHGNETEQFVKAVMNVAAERFLDPSLKATLYMTLNKVVILEAPQSGLTLDTDSTATLNSFCEWQSTWNLKDDSNPEHADYVLLLTKLDLEHNGNKANSGLARKGMCGVTTKCSVNEDNGLGAGLIIAHETGHVLGMNHDGTGNSCPDGRYIMSSLASSGPDALKWSTCSADTLKAALSTSELNCLNDQPPGTAEKSYQPSAKPGTIYSANHQCRIMRGETAEICADVHANGLDVCGSIVCRDKPDTGVNGCVIYSTPRMDGTDCGSRKWCIGGRCVAMGPGSPGPVNGGWSNWDPTFSACSRSCGGGVKTKRRYCNNPEPQYGGHQCAGSAYMGEVCNVQPCATSQTKFQEEQCAATDSQPIQGHTYHWVPNAGALGDESCLVNCQAAGTNWFSKRGINKDGTECISDERATFHRCIGGTCKTFGCDGHMGSGLQFDECAVCNGHGDTCTKVSGHFNGGTAKVFTTFAHIPTGSTGVTITQGNAYCFLNVKINGKNLFSESAPRSSGTYTIDGISIRYNSKPERVEIVGPTGKYIQAQVYRQYGPPYVGVDPDIYYEYHTPKGGSRTNNYMWKTQTVACNKQCGTGTQVPVVTCVNQNSATVEDHFCNINDKPREDVQQCNTHSCPPRWRTSNWGQCSQTCGGGSRHRTVECVEENNNVEKVLPSARCHASAKPTDSSQCNTNDCPGVWKTGAWSACSETCARGTRSRDVKCYRSSSSSSPVSDSQCNSAQKPTATEYCVLKPCRTDISGSHCVDKQANCFQSYGEGVCNGQYKSWAKDNCMKSCGVCSESPAQLDPNCKDKLANCDQYQPGFCTDSAYQAWAKSNCKRHCGYCATAEVTTAVVTTTAASIDPNCLDAETNCAAYTTSVCTQYAAWSKTHCKKFCGMCELTQQRPATEDENVCIDKADCAAYGESICSRTEFAQTNCRRHCGLCPVSACQDQDDNCENYESTMCTEYRPWATAHCQGFCNLCGARRKRAVAGTAPQLPVEPPLARLKLLQDEIPTEDVEPVDDSSEEDQSLEQDLDSLALDSGLEMPQDVVIKIPPQPVCNILLTSSKGSVDAIRNLTPDTLCEQTIALPLDNQVILVFNDINIDCEAGKTATITDGMTNVETDLCTLLPEKTWVSEGSIVSIKFTPFVMGQGYSFTYHSLPLNNSISECSQHLTARSRQVELIQFPAGYSSEDTSCEIYITTKPGKLIQLVFKDFKMTGNLSACKEQEGLLIEDLVGGEADTFCGDLSPFVWESRGSRVRLVYSQIKDDLGFSAFYSVIDV